MKDKHLTFNGRIVRSSGLILTIPPKTPTFSGLRLPTEAEWNDERESWSSNDLEGALNSPLHLTAAGQRNGTHGGFFGVGTSGHYWSSSAQSSSAVRLDIFIDDAYTNGRVRGNGGSVRLILDEENITLEDFNNNYKNKTIFINGNEYGYCYNPTTNKVWLDRNLGATQVATTLTDSDAYGDLFQWGRAADGHEKRDSNTITGQSTTAQPAHGDFIIGQTDWLTPQNDELWQGVEGINNPANN